MKKEKLHINFYPIKNQIPKVIVNCSGTITMIDEYHDSPNDNLEFINGYIGLFDVSKIANGIIYMKYSKFEDYGLIIDGEYFNACSEDALYYCKNRIEFESEDKLIKKRAYSEYALAKNILKTLSTLKNNNEELYQWAISAVKDYEFYNFDWKVKQFPHWAPFSA